MKPNERKEALLAIKENIEMDLFSSEESSEVLSTQELDEENCFYQRITIHHRSKLNLEHPLVSIWEEELTPEGHAQQDGLQNPKPSTVTPAQENKSIERRPPPPVFMDDIEIEMEVIPPPRKSEAKLVEVVTTTFHTASLNKASRMKWKRLTPEQTGLVVKDVICLRRGHYSEEIMRNTAPQGKEQAAISAMGMTARITIDREWSAKQMESRLVVLFRGRVAIQAGQRFSFTYLQCIQGVPFVPVTPSEGWTGAQVLKITGQGALYIVSHHDNLQASSDTVVVDGRQLCLEEVGESCPDGDNLQKRWSQPHTQESIDGASFI
ncbi:uncharacterized protein LOC133481016 isoform X4 [Phyllopteryx taeniolatus]|uniref:uncharacterized protein LOC133481016 isoform X4 n=1 Tax=Phyllopteryx taeniolatus TaxID=161469 RepID=UPI002AD3EF7D|nr:uncharacterized protein LOC133481016 isoform X4 [Phyllopteryx taeniolatus]